VDVSDNIPNQTPVKQWRRPTDRVERIINCLEHPALRCSTLSYSSAILLRFFQMTLDTGNNNQQSRGSTFPYFSSTVLESTERSLRLRLSFLVHVLDKREFHAEGRDAPIVCGSVRDRLQPAYVVEKVLN
jgi:hypothetical protein